MVCEPRGLGSLSVQAVTAAICHPSSTMSPECTKMLSSTHSAGGQSLAQQMLDLTLKRYPQLPFMLSPAATYELQWRLIPGPGWQLGPQGSFVAGSRVPRLRKDPHTCVTLAAGCTASLAEIHLGQPRGAGNSAGLSQP